LLSGKFLANKVCVITPFSKGLSLFKTPKNIGRVDFEHIKGVARLSVFHGKSQDCHSGIYLFGGLCKELHSRMSALKRLACHHV
jgi:hypothetical protein